jgi:hypothetical protein
MVMLNLLLLIFGRSLIISVKYGRFSKEHFDMLRMEYMSEFHLSANLIMVKMYNTKLQFNYFLEDLDLMKLDEIDFKLQVYKNQEQFRIKNWDNLKERLLDEEKFVKYHND